MQLHNATKYCRKKLLISLSAEVYITFVQTSVIMAGNLIMVIDFEEKKLSKTGYYYVSFHPKAAVKLVHTKCLILVTAVKRTLNMDRNTSYLYANFTTGLGCTVTYYHHGKIVK